MMIGVKEKAENIRSKAEEYAHQVKSKVPNLDKWEEELNKILLKEKNEYDQNLQSQIKNYKTTINNALNDLYFSLPNKFQKSKELQEIMSNFSKHLLNQLEPPKKKVKKENNKDTPLPPPPPKHKKAAS